MAPLALSFGGYQGPASVHTRSVHEFIDALGARLGDQVAVAFDPDITKSGYKTSDLPRRVEEGSLTFCYIATSLLAAKVPAFRLLDLPFAVRDRAHAYGLVDGPLGTALADAYEAVAGVRILGYWDNGVRHLSNAVRPLRRPSDTEGLRIRTMPSPAHERIFGALGFEPVPLDAAELAEVVRSGRVDAQENPLTNWYNFGIVEYHRFVTLTGHLFGAAGFLCNAEAFASWPEEVRDAVHEAAGEATARQRTLAAAEDEAILAKLDPGQCEIYTPSNEERAAWAAAVASLVEDEKARHGETLTRHLD